MKPSLIRIQLFGVLLLALAVRLFWVTQPRIVWGDEPFYLWLGQSLLDGNGYQFFGISGVHFSPLFPLLAGLIAQVARAAGVDAAQALMVGSATLYTLCGALLTLPLYGIARRLAGLRTGLATGLVVAVYPALTAATPLWGTMTEPLYLLLVATAWWALLLALETDRLVAYLLAGVLLALAYLTRTEALVYLVAGLGVLGLLRVFLVRATPLRARLRSLAGLGLALLVFFVVTSPYLVILHEITGKWHLVEEAGSTYVSAQGLAYGDVAAFDQATWGLDPDSGEVYLFSPASEEQGLLEAIVDDPRAFARLLRINLLDLQRTLFSARLLPWSLLSLVALGLFAQPWGRRRLRGEMLLAASLAGPLSFLPFFIQDRYVAGALLPALVWLGGGVAWLGRWLADTATGLAPRWAGRPAPRKMLLLAPALLLAVVLLWEGPRLWASLQYTNSFQPGHLSAAAELRDRGVLADTVVMSRYPAIAFHAGTRWAPTPAASWTEVLDYAQRRGADYLAIDRWETELRPQLAFLLDPTAAPATLRHVATVDAGAGPVVVYELIQQN